MNRFHILCVLPGTYAAYDEPDIAVSKSLCGMRIGTAKVQHKVLIMFGQNFLHLIQCYARIVRDSLMNKGHPWILLTRQGADLMAAVHFQVGGTGTEFAAQKVCKCYA